MFLERLYEDALAQASYLIGCEKTGTAIVIDPLRDAERYLAAAAAHGLRITAVTETHIHADFVSGARELARRTGAELVLSGEGSADWRYRFAEQDGARLVRDGDAIDVGAVQLVVRHTPGHTPEHIAFLVTDRATSDRPVGMCTGDFLFAGDVGRPDLLERAADERGTADVLARELFRSVRALRPLPDYLQIWPGHGAGSACGKALGALPSSTLGYERLTNWAFQIEAEEQFIRAVLADQPEPPRYFGRMKIVNRDGPPPTPDGALPGVDVETVRRAFAAGDQVVDTRPTLAFASGHVPRAINLPLGSSFLTWAGSLLSYERDIVLLDDDASRADRARRALSLIGLDRVVGWAAADVREAWARDLAPLQSVPQIDVAALAASRERVVVDVRRQSEWDAGHLPGAAHYFLGDLVDLTRFLSRDTPIALHCQGGTRSAIAASVLQAQGFTNVSNVAGGYRAWTAAGLPVERDDHSSH